LCALTFAAGAYEAICFLSFGKVFTAFQTGNIVFLGLIAAGTRPPSGPDPETVIASVVAFAVGAAVAMPILRSFNGDEEIEDQDVVRVWPRRVSIALAIALVVQLGFLALWMANPQPGRVSVFLVAMNAFAVGIQMNAVRSLHVPGVSTTAATATYISLISTLVTRSLRGPGVWRLAAVLLSMALGALVGDWMLIHLHSYAPLPPVVVIALVVAIASLVFRRRPRRAGAAPAASPVARVPSATTNKEG
jgi:uncharacterized membrane protein YoaK (UPF0700 family)